ncbi:hypothetical protein K7X08_021242 [Anisodus acutangulus]|uniref:UDP-N-acetylglucosamine transferase subunit ALG14 n=1 Tax=Anisodus acutangulus TaxID=402998 RepID=A0A9Q1M2F3_9SOLA|nr:hypothetical protein K7X08_021242 [Anisodus acutangulus]
MILLFYVLWNHRFQAGVDALGRAEFMQIYRSREVGQSYITSVGTTMIAIAHALWLMIKIRSKVILCNGPGTCVPLCVIAFLFKVLGIRWSSVFYVESIARVRRLSLNGLLLYTLGIVNATIEREISLRTLCELSNVNRVVPKVHLIVEWTWFS